MVSFKLDTQELDQSIITLNPLLDFDPLLFMESMGSLGETQTRRRIISEKTSPDGDAWDDNREGTSILQKTGRNLLDSVAFVASADEAEWGASWEHAHVHQNGAVITPKNAKRLAFASGGKTIFAKRVTIPARPFVGMSEDNRQEMKELATDFFSIGGLQ